MSQRRTPDHGRPYTPGHGAFAGRAGKPATLGIIGLVLIGINISVVIVSTVVGPHMFVVGAATVDSTGFLSDIEWSGLTLGLVLRVMANVALGLAGWVVGVVATVTNRGRSFGIAAIALGGVLFVIAVNMMFGALLIKSLG